MGSSSLVVLVSMVQHAPHVLLLDEPTAALDEVNARLVIESLKTLAREKKMVILVVTHDMELLAEYAQGNYFELKRTTETSAREIVCCSAQ